MKRLATLLVIAGTATIAYSTDNPQLCKTMDFNELKSLDDKELIAYICKVDRNAFEWQLSGHPNATANMKDCFDEKTRANKFALKKQIVVTSVLCK